MLAADGVHSFTPFLLFLAAHAQSGRGAGLEPAELNVFPARIAFPKGALFDAAKRLIHLLDVKGFPIHEPHAHGLLSIDRGLVHLVGSVVRADDEVLAHYLGFFLDRRLLILEELSELPQGFLFQLVSPPLSSRTTHRLTACKVSITPSPRLATASKCGRFIALKVASSSRIGTHSERSRLLYWKTKGNLWMSYP